MPLRHRQLLPDQLHLFMQMEDAIMDNAEVLRALVAAADGFLGDDLSATDDTPVHSHAHDHGGAAHGHDALSDEDHSRVRTVLRQIVREWSADGKRERDAVHGPLISTLLEWSDGQSRDRCVTHLTLP